MRRALQNDSWRMVIQMTEVLIYDAFTQIPGKGNPAGVVLNATGLSDSQMMDIAKELGFNESAFIFPSEVADYRIRYFTPGQEVPMCGHATMASVYAMVTQGVIPEEKLAKGKITLEILAGVIEIEIHQDEEGGIRIGMNQNPYQEVLFTGDKEALTRVIGLEVKDLDERYPICFVNTGLWALLVPIKEIKRFQDMKPDNWSFPGVLTQNPESCIHPICMKTLYADCQMHGRHFSTPYAGTEEDPVTGTASGAMGAYYRKHVDPREDEYTTIKVEQGQEIGCDGIVEVTVSQDLKSVKIYGTAVYTGRRVF